MTEFSHIDEQGRASMVDVSDKIVSHRSATARSIVVLPEAVLAKLSDGDIYTKKGAVFQTAIIAGVMAAKRTGELIPLCHPLGLENCQVTINLNEARANEQVCRWRRAYHLCDKGLAGFDAFQSVFDNQHVFPPILSDQSHE